MRLIFMGTPDFSVPTLEKLIESEHEVVCCVTQEDKARGRSGKLTPTPVKECALKNNIEVLTPIKIRNNVEFIEKLRTYNADAIIVIAFGQILPTEVLNMTKYGCINIHASLLPEYRGAAPIQWAVIDGLKETGITIMQMDEGLDTGDIINVKKIPIDKKETGGSLFDKLALLGPELLLDTLKLIEEGKVNAIKQDESKSSYAKKLDKKTGLIDFNQTSESIERLVRGLDPWPSAYTYFAGKMLKIWDCECVDESDKQGGFGSNSSGDLYNPGKLLIKGKDKLFVKTKDGFLSINELQLEGKKRMDTKSFLLGINQDKLPDYLG